MENCIFCKIINNEIPSSRIYEDENVFVCLDIHPVNIGHVLVISKNHFKNLYETPDEVVGKIFCMAKKIAITHKEKLKADGVNIHMNNDIAAGQVIFHTHVHIIPRYENDGFQHWHGKQYNENEIASVFDQIKNAL
ncbi:MAG: HIT family protein [Candidatus Pacebacteria bacterium]|nr:HIT family protein [Candidatus Paceibacterota bacterium]MBP9716086.1 HIT family protein [Candidatus Paceibacterota bacterium]